MALQKPKVYFGQSTNSDHLRPYKCQQHLTHWTSTKWSANAGCLWWYKCWRYLEPNIAMEWLANEGHIHPYKCQKHLLPYSNHWLIQRLLWKGQQLLVIFLSPIQWWVLFVTQWWVLLVVPANDHYQKVKGENNRESFEFYASIRMLKRWTCNESEKNVKIGQIRTVS